MPQDSVGSQYRNHLGEGLSVEIDFATRTITGPGAQRLKKDIESWERAVAKNKYEHWIGSPWRDPVRIDHPWFSLRDMVVFMALSRWDDLEQWPPELAALIPESEPEETPGPDTLFIVY